MTEISTNRAYHESIDDESSNQAEDESLALDRAGEDIDDNESLLDESGGLGIVDVLHAANDKELSPDETAELCQDYLEHAAANQRLGELPEIPTAITADKLDEFSERLDAMAEELDKIQANLAGMLDQIHELQGLIEAFIEAMKKFIELVQHYEVELTKTDSEEAKTKLAADMQRIVNGFPETVLQAQKSDIDIRRYTDNKSDTPKKSDYSLAA